MGQVTYNNAFYSEGQTFELPAFGLVENGGTKEVGDSQIAAWKRSGHEWPDDGHLVINVAEAEAEAAEPAPVEPSGEETPSEPVTVPDEADTTGGGQ